MAAETFKVEIIERQTVKPSSPTPSHLRNYNLSLLDRMAPQTYIPFLLFYPSRVATSTATKSINERCEHLVQSLSKTLAHFYPLAGRIKGKAMIECNDDGAEFVKARVLNCSLSEVLELSDAEMLRPLVPMEVESKEAGTGRLLVVQVNLFKCGGMAIGLSVSHKISDAVTLCTFINCWAATAHQSNKVVLPQFGAASLFTPPDFSYPESPAREAGEGVGEKCMTRRYVFDASKITALQSKVASSAVPKPTRVEAVSAIIWKCAIEASSNMLGSNLIRPSLFSHAIDMRRKAVPPLPESLVGNLVDISTAEYSGEVISQSNGIDLKDLVAKIRRGFEENKEIFATKVAFDSKEAWQKRNEYTDLMMKNDGIDKYMCSSWCGLPFYEADFGWGKPSWVSVDVSMKNLTSFMDRRDCNGIEAYVTLSRESMALFECNSELLAYASLNPKEN